MLSIMLQISFALFAICFKILFREIFFLFAFTLPELEITGGFWPISFQLAYMHSQVKFTLGGILSKQSALVLHVITIILAFETYSVEERPTAW